MPEADAPAAARTTVLILSEGAKVSGPTTWKDGLVKALQAQGWRAIEIDSLRPLSLLRLPELRRVRTIHAYHVGGTTLPYLLAARLTGRRVVFTVHGDFYQEALAKTGLKRLLWLPFNRLAIKAAHRVTFPSEFIYRHIRAGTQTVIRKALVIPNGIDPASFMIGRTGDTNRLLAVTSFNYPQKTAGLVPLIEAVTTLRAARPGLSLDILGDGTARPELERRYGTDHIRFHGKQPVGDYLAAAGLFVHSTFLDNLPYVLLEAMAAKRPIVTVPVGGIPEMVSPDCLAEPTADGLAQKITDVLSDRRLRASMIKQNDKLLKKFEWKTVGYAFVETYQA